ncbi:MAG: hypothetical protein P8P30_05210 [Rickettsiales bacterium]|nr:hypothetical protein [Rickettsiales bacterium]
MPNSKTDAKINVTAIAYKQGDAPSGGMGVVAKATGAKTLFGANPTGVDDDLWNRHSLYNSRGAYVSKEVAEGQEFEIINFDVPESARKMHYDFSNEIIWPLMHSMKIETSCTVDEIEDLYTGYMYYNDLQNKALADYSTGNLTDKAGQPLTTKREPLDPKKDQMWVHDYQSINVPGTAFSWHIPFPTLEHFQQTTFEGGKRDEQGEYEVDENGIKKVFEIPILETGFFNDYIGSLANIPLKSFQRPQDQINLLMLMAYIDPEFSKENPELLGEFDINDPKQYDDIREKLSEHVKTGSLTKIKFKGNNVSMVSVPVGIDVDKMLEAAESRFSPEQQFKTVLDKDAVFKAVIGKDDQGKNVLYNGVGENFTPLDPKEYKDKDLTLNEIVESVEGRNWMLAIHRNDYTKGSEEMLLAAKKYFEEEPERALTDTFFCVLQPTRIGVPGYEDYANGVLNLITSIKIDLVSAGISQKDADKAFAVVPQGVEREDVMRLMNRDEAKVYLAPSFKDGYALMPTEFVAANINTKQAKGVISTSGAGNSEVLWNGQTDEKRKGAHIIDMPKAADKGQLNEPKIEENISNQILDSIKFILDPQNAKKVKEDFDFMGCQVLDFDAGHFNDTIQGHYQEAIEHAGGDLLDKSHGEAQRRDRGEPITKENAPLGTPFTPGKLVQAYDPAPYAEKIEKAKMDLKAGTGKLTR